MNVFSKENGWNDLISHLYSFATSLIYTSSQLADHDNAHNKKNDNNIEIFKNWFSIYFNYLVVISSECAPFLLFFHSIITSIVCYKYYGDICRNIPVYSCINIIINI